MTQSSFTGLLHLLNLKYITRLSVKNISNSEDQGSFLIEQKELHVNQLEYHTSGLFEDTLSTSDEEFFPVRLKSDFDGGSLSPNNSSFDHIARKWLALVPEVMIKNYLGIHARVTLEGVAAMKGP